VALASAAAAPASEFFAAPNGSASGDGSRARPWDLATALGEPRAVRPGDTITLVPGTYRGEFRSKLRGRRGAPIVVRGEEGGRATIDGTLRVSGVNAWYRGFEVTSSAPARVSRQDGPYPTDVPRGILATDASGETGEGLKLIDLVAHDLASVLLEKDAVDLEISGCLVYYNGWTAPDRGHGHGIYVQNVSGTKTIRDNVIFENFDNGIQAYGSAAAGLDNLDIEGNTIFENGAPVGDPANNVLVGGGRVAKNTRIVGNLLWFSGFGRGTQINLGYDPYGAGVDGAVVKDNHVVNGEVRMNPKNGVVDFSGNTVFANLANLDPRRYPGNRWTKTPTDGVFVRPDRYEKGRAIVTVFNAGRKASVAANLASVLAKGERYEVRNAQNFYGAPIAAGVFDGGAVVLPMRAFPAASPAGWKAPAPTGPAFNVFVVMRTGEPGGPSAGRRDAGASRGGRRRGGGTPSSAGHVARQRGRRRRAHRSRRRARARRDPQLVDHGTDSRRLARGSQRLVLRRGGRERARDRDDPVARPDRDRSLRNAFGGEFPLDTLREARVGARARDRNRDGGEHEESSHGRPRVHLACRREGRADVILRGRVARRRDRPAFRPFESGFVSCLFSLPSALIRTCREWHPRCDLPPAEVRHGRKKETRSRRRRDRSASRVRIPAG